MRKDSIEISPEVPEFFEPFLHSVSFHQNAREIMLLEQSSIPLRGHTNPKPHRKTSRGNTDNLLLDIQILQKNTTALYVY